MPTSTAKITALGITSVVLQFFNIIMLAITALTVTKICCPRSLTAHRLAPLSRPGDGGTINGLVLSGMVFRDESPLRKTLLDSIELGDPDQTRHRKYILISIKCYIVDRRQYAASSLR